MLTNLRLVAIDLDGTLLDDQKRISSTNRNSLKLALSRGVIIALASARDCASIRIKLPYEIPGLYYIGSGGALVYDVVNDSICWNEYLSPELVQEGYKYLKRYGYPVFLNTVNDYWVDRRTEQVEMIEERYNLNAALFSNIQEVTKRIMRISLAAPVSTLRQAANGASYSLRNKFHVSLASQDWLDLLAVDAGKGAALQWMQKRLGILPEQTMAIGDYESDLPLFDYADYRIAMGNAVPSLKAAATFITSSNNEDGVARVLEMFTPL